MDHREASQASRYDTVDTDAESEEKSYQELLRNISMSVVINDQFDPDQQQLEEDEV